MADEQKDVQPEENGQKTEGEQKAEEKKGGKVSGFFRNLGNKINDATYDTRAESNFNANHAEYTVYTGIGVLSHTAVLHAEEYPNEGYIVALGEDDNIGAGNVIICEKDKSARYIAAIEQTTLSFTFEDKQNEKKAMKITLGEPAEKVDVIKAGENYYLKK